MSGPPDKRFLIGVMIFGVVMTAADARWLSRGSIVIREGRGNGPVAGTIHGKSVLYYPLCIAWGALGVSMVALSVLAFFSSKEIFLRLSAYSCVALLLMAVVTVAAALWSGP